MISWLNIIQHPTAFVKNPPTFQSSAWNPHTSRDFWKISPPKQLCSASPPRWNPSQRLLQFEAPQLFFVAGMMWMSTQKIGDFTPKSSHLFIGFWVSIIFTIHFGGFPTIFGNTHVYFGFKFPEMMDDWPHVTGDVILQVPVISHRYGPILSLPATKSNLPQSLPILFHSFHSLESFTSISPLPQTTEMFQDPQHHVELVGYHPSWRSPTSDYPWKCEAMLSGC